MTLVENLENKSLSCSDLYRSNGKLYRDSCNKQAVKTNLCGKKKQSKRIKLFKHDQINIKIFIGGKPPFFPFLSVFNHHAMAGQKTKHTASTQQVHYKNKKRLQQMIVSFFSFTCVCCILFWYLNGWVMQIKRKPSRNTI